MEQLSLENGILLDITLNIDWIYLSDNFGTLNGNTTMLIVIGV
jgi:hypothetical protein